MVPLVPFFVLSEHRIQDAQQLAHAGNQRDFFGLPWVESWDVV